MRQKEYNDLLSKIKCSDDFRKRMQEKLSAEPVDTSDYEDIVSGTEVITAKHRRNKFAAMAAAVVLICGVAGGGAYHFANMPDNDENIEQDIEDDGTIYSHLKANIDKCGMDVTLCLYDTGSVYLCGSTIMGYPDCEPDKFFEYMDNFDMRNEVEEGDILETSESLKVVFADDDYTIAYIFEIYANGDCKWTEKHGEDERTTYHSFVDGEKVYMELLKMFTDETVVARFGNSDNVSREEIEEFLDSGFANRNDDRAYFYREDQSSGIEYTVKNKTGLRDELLGFEWERADGYSIGATDYWLLGFILSNNGYMKRLDGKNFKIYKLKNRSDLEEFRAILNTYLVLNEYGTNASKEDILNAFHEGYNGGRARFRVDDGQFTEETECTLENFESFKDEISELEWVTCEVSEPLIYKDFYVAGAIISRNGYIHPQSDGTHQCAYKLKNESDIEILRDICDRYIKMKNE